MFHYQNLVIAQQTAHGVEFFKIHNILPGLHLFCFISNAVKKQPVDIFENFEGVA